MSPDPRPKILVVSGEDSGDFHGANLVREIRRQQPTAVVSGVGGLRMAAAGVKLLFPSSRLAVVGLTEVLSHLPAIAAGRRRILTYLDEERPDLVVLIDFPDFNLNLIAPQVKKRRLPLVYYISPQLWAWRPGRVAKIKALVDRMLVILPFEEEFYRRRGLEVTYVGHPLVDDFAAYRPLPRQQRPYLALLPGSRGKEVSRLLPAMMETAQWLRRRRPEQEFILPLAPSLDEGLVTAMIPAELRPAVKLVREPLSTCLRRAFFAIVSSGTATLETALAEVPMVVVYRLGKLTYQAGRMLISVPHISLVNLIAGREVVPELLQDEVCAARIFPRVMAVVDDEQRWEQVVADLRRVKAKLGPPGASARAAAAALACLSGAAV